MPADDTAAPRTTRADTRAPERTNPSSNLLAAVLDTAPVALAVWGLDGTFLRVNQTFAQLTDRPADEHAGLSCEQVMGDESPVCTVLREVAHSGVAREGVEVPGPGDPDLAPHLVASFAPVADPDGSVVGV